MKALVTGSAGFVGKVFMGYLAKKGYQVTGIDIANDPPIDARDFFKHSDEKFDLVIHLAAIVGGRAMIEGQPLAVATDLAIDSDFFQWCLRTRPADIVYYSSSAAYPISLQRANLGKLTENDIDLEAVENPDETYGWAKLTGEILAQYARKEGLRVHIFRPFSGTGETQSLDYPLPSIVARAMRREAPLLIWSNTVRDFIHINDIVKATMKVVEKNIPTPVNLCTGVATSFTQVALAAARAVGYDPQIVVGRNRPTGVQHRVGDPTKMLTFYKPTISFEQIVARMVAHQIVSNRQDILV